MTVPARSLDSSTVRKDAILDAAIAVFGRFGYRKTSVEDLAQAAGLSKQGLYLHFVSKDAIFTAALRKYLDDCLALLREALEQPGTPLFDRLCAAMDVWFGRHLSTFMPVSFDIIEAGDRLSGKAVEGYKAAFQVAVSKALARSIEFKRAGNICSPKDVASVLFQCGLTWKEPHMSRDTFRKKMALCIRAACQVESR